MPSVTVVVSSDTDIYISPGLYGDCLPTSATGASADSFRAGHSRCRVFPSDFMLAHGPRRRQRPVEGPERDSRHMDAMAIVKVT
ncbi:hypothetical protein C3492_42545 [Streptomyces sp. Ru62]|nr:hypothetical protein C3492_42545 [Streptomyces sp. Ru62]